MLAFLGGLCLLSDWPFSRKPASYDALTGDLTAIKAGSGNAVQDFRFGHDLITSRADANTGLSETFTYVSLNRLRTATVGVDIAKTVSYDTIGNIRTKSDVGTYSYPAPGQPFPHAVSSVAGSVINTSFAYDANGNQTGGNGLAIIYASFNKPTQITRGATSIGFNHDPEHQRYRQVAPGKEVLYLTAGGVLVEKITGTSGSVTWNNYLFVAGKMVGMRVERGDDVQTRYFHRDHLGSVAILTDEAGNVVERLRYDAWGKRRQPNGQDDPAGSLTSQTTRGFTGHEQLDDVGLVHMNGRVYDPLLGRFGTPDPMTENPFSTQGWNRYSYVGNSPLNFADPSGYCFMGCFWQKPFKALGKLLNKIPILGQILQIAAVALCTAATFGACSPIAVAVLSSAFVAGVRSGSLGAALKAGLITAVTAGAMQVVGDLTGGLGLDGVLTKAGGHGPLAFMSEAHLFNIAGHAAVGCLSAMASGGKCGPGAMSGAAGSIATPLTEGMGGVAALAAHSVVGGVASVAGGGKFGSGAVTAAFGYLFNRMLRAEDASDRGENKFQRVFYLDKAAGPNGGMVLQRIDMVEVWANGEVKSFSWYEAFPVAPGGTSGVGDIWGFGDCCSGEIKGEATYYDGLTAKYLKNELGFQPPTIDFKPNPDAVPYARDLYSRWARDGDLNLGRFDGTGSNTVRDSWRYQRQ